MNWPEVQQRIAGGESAHTEFKRGPGDLSGLGKTVCAFANGDGGLLIIGVDDAGAAVGVKENPETVQERLTGLLQTGCGKPVTAECGRHDAGGRWVHWIEVHRHQRGYEPFSYDGGFSIRRGRSTGAPSASELQELLNAFGLVLTEKQILPSATVDDIDFGAVRTFLRAQGLDTEREPQPAREDDLRNASIVDELDGVLRPTLYGVLVFGRDSSRNEMMANAMVVSGLMERRGRGWLTMRHTMRRFNGTEPELLNDERNRFVRVTFERGARGA